MRAGCDQIGLNAAIISWATRRECRHVVGIVGVGFAAAIKYALVAHIFARTDGQHVFGYAGRANAIRAVTSIARRKHLQHVLGTVGRIGIHIADERVVGLCLAVIGAS